MLLHLLFSAGRAGAISGAAAAPAFGAASLAILTGGECPSYDGSPITPCTLRLSWSVANPDTSLYETRVYEHGVLIATLSNTLALYDIPLGQLVLYGRYNQFNSDWSYRVDVVRKADAGVISSQTSNVLNLPLGYCDT